MASDTTTRPAPPEEIQAVPVRHPGRWIAAAVIALLIAMFVHMLLTNPVFQWSFMFDNMFSPPVLRGARTTLIMTVLAMLIGVLLGIVVAVMRLSPNPVVSGAAWAYVWFFRAIPRLVLLFFCASLGALYGTYAIGIPFDHQLMSLLGLSGDLRFLGLDGNQIFSGFFAGLLGLSLSEGAYMAEIVRAGIQSVDPGQTEEAGEEPAEDLVAVQAEEAQVTVDAQQAHDLVVERDAQVVGAVQRAQAGAEEQQHEARDGPEEPDIGPGGPGDDGVGREPHDRDDDPQQDADQHREDRHDQRRPHTGDDRRPEHVVEHEPPLEHGVREQHVHEHQRQDGDDGRGDPAAGVPDRHRPNLLGRRRSGRALQRHGVS